METSVAAQHARVAPAVLAQFGHAAERRDLQLRRGGGTRQSVLPSTWVIVIGHVAGSLWSTWLAFFMGQPISLWDGQWKARDCCLEPSGERREERAQAVLRHAAAARRRR